MSYIDWGVLIFTLIVIVTYGIYKSGVRKILMDICWGTVLFPGIVSAFQ